MRISNLATIPGSKQYFGWTVWTVFEKIEKSRKMAVFGHFWANFGYVSHIQAIRF